MFYFEHFSFWKLLDCILFLMLCYFTVMCLSVLFICICFFYSLSACILTNLRFRVRSLIVSSSLLNSVLILGWLYVRPPRLSFWFYFLLSLTFGSTSWEIEKLGRIMVKDLGSVARRLCEFCCNSCVTV